MSRAMCSFSFLGDMAWTHTGALKQPSGLRVEQQNLAGQKAHTLVNPKDGWQFLSVSF